MNIGVNARLLLGLNMEGIARFTYETTYKMALDHPNDSFFLFFDRNVAIDFGFPENVHNVIVPLQARHPFLWHTWFEYLLPYYFKKYQIDVFYSTDGYLSLSTQVPTLLVVHDLAYLYYPSHIAKLSLKHYQYFIPRYIKKAKAIISVSQFVKNDIIHHFKTPEDKISVAYNAINAPKSNKLDSLSSEITKPYFIYVGSLNPRKNIVRLIDAFDTFNGDVDHKFTLVLAGRLAWKSKEIKEKIDQSPHVIHLGEISETNKYILLKNALALVYISLFEGFGIPILEAMMSGIPVITSSISSMPEVAGDAAICVDPKNTTEIAEAMKQIATQPNVRAALIAKGNKRYRDFSWANSANIIYNQLVKIKS